MRRSTIISLAMLLLIGAACTPTSTPSSPVAPDTLTPAIPDTGGPAPVGVVGRTQDVVELGRTLDALKPLSDNEQLYGDDVLKLRDGGEALLSFLNGLQLTLFNDSVVGIIRAEPGQDTTLEQQIFLFLGGFTGQLTSGPGHSAVFKTPGGAAITVLGTEFLLVYDTASQITTVGNFGGSVEVAAGGSSIPLASGHLVEVPPGGTPGVPLTLAFTRADFDRRASALQSPVLAVQGLLATATPTPTSTATPTITPTSTETPTQISVPTTATPTGPGPATPTPTWTSTPTSSVAHVYPKPQVIANYMPWYGTSDWSAGCTSDADSPQAGPYNSDLSTTITRQIKDAQTAGLDGFAVHWGGTGDRTDKNFATILSLSGGAFHSTATYLGHFFYGTASQATVVGQLQYILKNYSNSASFLRMNNKPAIMFADMPRIAIEGGQSTPQQAWAAVRAQVDPAHTTLWIAEGLDKTYMETFDGIYIYKIDHACCSTAYQNATKWAGWAREYELLTGQPRYFVGTIQPGWDDLNSAKPGCEDVRISSAPFSRDREGGAYYQRTFNVALAANPDMLLVHSFNEWVEGSYSEPSVNYGNFYLTLTAQFAATYHASR